MIYIQCGRNDRYPKEIETWRYNIDDSLPEWISDNCKIGKVDEFGKLHPTVRNGSKGGYEILNEHGTALITTHNDTDYICYGEKKLFVLTEKQLRLLYMPK